MVHVHLWKDYKGPFIWTNKSVLGYSISDSEIENFYLFYLVFSSVD